MLQAARDMGSIRTNLAYKTIGNDTFDRLQKLFPVAASDSCPTCDGRREYSLDGKTYQCDCETQRLLQKHYFAANIGREYHDICLDHFVGENRAMVHEIVTDYLEYFDDNYHYGLGLSFSGPLGTGKTFAMTCVLKELVKQGRNVYFITFDDLVHTWGSAYKDDEARKLQEKLQSVEVLGLDELRSDGRNHSGFLSSGLEVVIRHRTSNLLPTLITTNMMPKEEEGEFAKAFSLLSARNRRIIMSGEDHRRGIVRDTNYNLAGKRERRPVC